MLNLITDLYIQGTTKLFVRLIPNKDRIANIILTGSVASSEAHLLSDLDIIIILKDGNCPKNFIKKYKKFLMLFSIICPHILPLKERLSNVYSAKSLSNKRSSMIKGYLLKQKYINLYGEEFTFDHCELSEILYYADKVKLLIKAKNNKRQNNKLNKLISHKIHQNKNNLPAEKTDCLAYKQVIKFDRSQYLLRPITTRTSNHCFSYNSFKELIIESNKFYQLHPQVNSIHYCSPWYVFIDEEVFVLHESFIQEFSTHYSKDLLEEVDKNDLRLYNFYLKDFNNYSQSEQNDFLNKLSLKYLANYKAQNLTEQSQPTFIDFNIHESIKLLKDPDQVTTDQISLCICTKNRKQSLKELFISLREQTLSPKEIIIINNGESWEESYINELKVGLDNSDINIFESSLPTISSLRNFAISKANMPIISFVDDDCYLPKTWLESVFNHFNSDQDLTLLGGTVIHERQDTLTQTETFHRNFLEERPLC